MNKAKWHEKKHLPFLEGTPDRSLLSSIVDCCSQSSVPRIIPGTNYHVCHTVSRDSFDAPGEQRSGTCTRDQHQTETKRVMTMTMMREVGERAGKGDLAPVVRWNLYQVKGRNLVPGTWATVGASTFLADSDDDGVASYLVHLYQVSYL